MSAYRGCKLPEMLKCHSLAGELDCPIAKRDGCGQEAADLHVARHGRASVYWNHGCQWKALPIERHARGRPEIAQAHAAPVGLYEIPLACAARRRIPRREPNSAATLPTLLLNLFQGLFKARYVFDSPSAIDMR